MISKFSTYLFLSKSCLIFSLTIEGDTERAYSETISGAYRPHVSSKPTISSYSTFVDPKTMS